MDPHIHPWMYIQLRIDDTACFVIMVCGLQDSPIWDFEQDFLDIAERGQSGVTLYYFSGRRWQKPA